MNRAELVQKFTAELDKALDACGNEFSPNAILGSLTKELNEQKNAVVLRLLGMEKEWHGERSWKVDHCNGRKSEITEYIATHCQPQIHAWLQDAVKETMTQLPAEVKRQVKAALRREIKERLSYALRDAAHSAATTLIDDIKNELVAEFRAGAPVEQEAA